MLKYIRNMKGNYKNEIIFLRIVEENEKNEYRI